MSSLWVSDHSNRPPMAIPMSSPDSLGPAGAGALKAKVWKFFPRSVPVTTTVFLACTRYVMNWRAEKSWAFSQRRLPVRWSRQTRNWSPSSSLGTRAEAWPVARGSRLSMKKTMPSPRVMVELRMAPRAYSQSGRPVVGFSANNRSLVTRLTWSGAYSSYHSPSSPR